jgi:hypothetical protein
MIVLALALIIRGLVFDGLPPVRFQNDVMVRVAFVSDLSRYCGQTPIGKHWGGCYDFKAQIIYAQNPCQMSGDYAKELCHEMGHANGWSRYHEF